jgi:hypothetical protein
MTAIILFFIFLFFAAVMLRGKMPALLAIPAMAVLMAMISGVGYEEILGEIVVDGTTRLGTAYMAVFFGALLGQVTILTGIAERIVKLAAEFCGDKPVIITFTLAFVTGVLFVALTGLGAVIMVGTLMLPILVSVGVPRKMAGAVFIMAFGTGYIMNMSLWEFYRTALGVDMSQVRIFAVQVLAVNFVVTILFILFYARKNLLFATCSVRIDHRKPPAGGAAVPGIALLTPLTPLIFHLGLGWPVIPAFIGGALYGVLTTKPREASRILTRAALKGLESGAPAIILMVGIGMLLNMSGMPEVQEVMEPVLGGLEHLPWWGFVLGFTLLSPLVLFRGPLNPFGLGIGIYAILNSMEVFPALAIMALLMSLTQVQTVCDPTNTHNVWVAGYTETPVMAITRMTLLFQMFVAFCALSLAAFWYF